MAKHFRTLSAKLVYLVLTTIFGLLISACDGSSGGSRNSTNTENYTASISGPDTVIQGHDASLHADVGTAATGDISLSWQQTGGTPVTLTTSDDQGIATFTAPTVTSTEDLVFELTVSADNGSVTAEKRVIVNPDPATVSANAGVDITTQPGNTVSLHGIGSGATSSETYSWQQLSGVEVLNFSGQTTSNPSFDVPNVNSDTTLVFELTVTDNSVSAKDTVTIEVISLVSSTTNNQQGSPETKLPLHLLLTTRQAPLSLAMPDAQAALKETDVTLAATTFGGSSNVSYSWVLDSTTPAAAAPTINNSSDSTPHLQLTTAAITGNVTYVYELTVQDDAGQIEVGTVALYVGETSAPSIPFTLNTRDLQIVEGDFSSAANIAASVSIAGGTAPFTYNWTQQSGPSLTLASADTATVKFAMPSISQDETAVLEVSVTDSSNAPVTEMATVNVHLLDRHIPQSATQSLNAQAFGELTIAPNLLTHIAANATGGDSNYSYEWQQISGTPATLANENTQTLSITAANTSTQETLRMQLKVTDGAGGEDTQTFLIVVEPNASELTAVALPSLQADEGQNGVLLNAIVTGGSGSYTYNWAYVPPASGTDLGISINNANQAVANFDAPVVSQDTLARFTVTVSDGNSQVVEEVSVRIHNFTAVQAHTLNEQVAKVGQTVHLQGAAASGGKPPYTYAWTQTQGTPSLTLSDSSILNPSFTLPDATVITQNTDFEFKLSVTDAAGNTNSVTESVKAITDMVVSLSAPDTMAANGSRDVTGDISTTVTGGLAPFTYSYSMNPVIDRTRLRLDDADTANPSLVRPSGVAGGDTTAITVTVTDSLGSIARSQAHTVSIGVASRQAQVGSYVPPQYDGQHKTYNSCTRTLDGSGSHECSDFDLFLGSGSDCPADKPFPFLRLSQNDDLSVQIQEFGCKTYSACQTDFNQLNDGRSVCSSQTLKLNRDNAASAATFDCTICCDGDDCNQDYEHAWQNKPLH